MSEGAIQMTTGDEAKGTYKMRTVSRLTGFSPALLRAWETRHGFLDPVRKPSGHRLYTEDDLTVLRSIRRLLDEGRAIGEIAAMGREELLEMAASADSVGPTPPAGAGLETDTIDALVNELIEGAAALDSERVRHAIDDTFARVSPAFAVDQVLTPAARKIGDLWHAGEIGIASEHLATSLFTRRVHALLEAQASTNDTRPLALVACLPDDPHELAALAVALHVGNCGYRIAFLGPKLPFEDLERSIQSLRPEMVLLSSTDTEIAEAHRAGLAEMVGRHRDDTRVWLGGAGFATIADELAGPGLNVWPAHEPLTASNASLLLGTPRDGLRTVS